jgi:four helix bundle protein
MVFTQRVRVYKLSNKYVKSVGSEVLSLGFPISEVEKGNLSLASVSEKIGATSFEESDGNIVFSLNDIGIKKDYEAWKETIQKEIIEVVKEPATLYQRSPDITEIISMIKNYDLANSTPMQGLNFIQHLKNQLKVKSDAMNGVEVLKVENMKIERFENIIAWQKAKELTIQTYRMFEKSKDFGFKDQIQRASVSIMNNIAEGFERKGNKEFSHFLYIAKGSCGEVRSMLYISLELNKISQNDFNKLFSLSEEISKILSGLIKTL